MKKLRTPLAWVTAAVLAGSGLVLSAGAAQAEPGTEAPTVEYVPGSAFVYNENETLVYNQWHYGNGSGRSYEISRQQPNGVVLDAGTQTQIIKGNNNDGADANMNASVGDLISTLDISASDESSLTYQIGIRVDDNNDGEWVEGEQRSTLRAATSDPDGVWTSSQPFGDTVPKNQPVALNVLLDAIGENAYPISYGFLSYNPVEEVLISSFTADGTITKFSAAPEAHVPGEAHSDYVTAELIRPNEVEYKGWHDGAPGKNAEATVKNFETVAGEGENETLGLKVDGKAQILNGLADEDFLSNGVEAGVAGMHIGVAEGSDPVWAQIPVFYYIDGEIAPRFTTLRAVVPASGNVSEATIWYSSWDLPGVIKNEETTLENILAAIGVHEVIGYGAYVDTNQSATLLSISYNGHTTNFAKAADVASYDVTYVVGGDADNITASAEDGSKLEAPEAPTREGYTFVGWYNGDVAWDFENDVVSGDVTLTAKWTKVTPPAPVPEVPFKDVPKSHMFYKPIQWLAENNLAAFGTTNPDYRPAAATTRGAMATFMVRMFESDYRPAADLVLPFKDVKKTDTHYRGIAWMWENGLVAKSDSYNATSPLTRGAMATFLYRYENGKADTVKNAFPYTDVDKNNVHHKTIAWMADQGFAISGKGAEKFNPTRDLTRGAMATFLYRIYQGKV